VGYEHPYVIHPPFHENIYFHRRDPLFIGLRILLLRYDDSGCWACFTGLALVPPPPHVRVCRENWIQRSQSRTELVRWVYTMSRWYLFVSGASKQRLLQGIKIGGIHAHTMSSMQCRTLASQDVCTHLHSMRQPQAHLRPYIRCFLVTGEEVRGNLEEAAKSFISQGSYASPRNCGDAASGWLPILLRMFRVCVMVGIKYKVCVGWAPVKCAPLGGYWRSGFWMAPPTSLPPR
jgi:hypothetical protein